MKLVKLLVLGLAFWAVVGLAQEIDSLDKEAVKYSQQGQFELAVQKWEEARSKLVPDSSPRKYMDMSVDLAAAYQSLGRLQDALKVLQSAKSVAEKSNDSLGLANVLGQLSDVYLAVGDLDHDGKNFTLPVRHLGQPRNIETAEKFLEQAKSVVPQKNQNPLLMANLLNKQGNVLVTKKDYTNALSAYREAMNLADQVSDETGKKLSAKISVNLVNTVAMQTGDYQQIQKELDNNTLSRVNRLPDSHDKSFMLIALARLVQTLQPSKAEKTSSELPSLSSEQKAAAYCFLNQAIEIAERQKDNLSLAYAKGYLGELYATEQRYEEAIELTRQAIFYAHNPGTLQFARYVPNYPELQSEFENHPELLYWLESQLGDFILLNDRRQKRIQEKTLAPPPLEAVKAYKSAMRYLKQIRWTYRVGSQPFLKSAVKLSFRLAYLLSLQAIYTTPEEEKKTLLKEVRDTIDLSKTIELQNYFNDTCITEKFSIQRPKGEEKTAERPEQPPRGTAVLSILAPDSAFKTDPFRLSLSLPDGTMKEFSSGMSANELVGKIKPFRDALALVRQRVSKITPKSDYRPLAEKFYEALIEPIDDILQKASIDTLIIIPDESLLSVPFATLWYKEKYLVQRYALAVTYKFSASLETQTSDSHSTNDMSSALLNGLPGEPSLPNVAEELRRVSELLGSMDKLEDADFTISNVERKLEEKPHSIVHLSTHGQFGKPEDTFLQAYDGKLGLDRLEALMGTVAALYGPVELITLSACESALGKEFGIAGIAVKAGTHSALATLWPVVDASTTELVVAFYGELKKEPSFKAKALQHAQKLLIENSTYRDPYYWAGFLLILNQPTISSWEP